MAHYLAAHPGLFMARKEMHFFGSDLQFGRQFYRRTQDEYLQEFRGGNGRRLAAEASVWYLFSTRAAWEIKAFSPDARILIMLREPAEMLHSLYGYFRFDGNEFLPTFAEALAAEPERRGGRRLGRRTYFPQGLAYRQTVRYAEQVQRYFEVFGRSRVRVVIYDDFAADAAAVCRETLEFLGLDPSRLKTDFAIVNPARQARNSVLQALLRDPLVRSAALAVRPWLPRFAFTAIQAVEARVSRFNVRPAPRPPLDPVLRRQLRRDFAPENAALSRLLGRDLVAWQEHDHPGEKPAPLPVWFRGAVAAH